MKAMPIMQDVRTVAFFPWSVFTPEDAQQALNNHNQSLHRLAERGGLAICELVALLEHRPWKQMPLAEAWEHLWQIVAFRVAQGAAS